MVVILKPDSAFEYMAKAGVTQKRLDELKSMVDVGMAKVKLTTTQFAFMFNPDFGGYFEVEVPTSTAELHALNAGTLKGVPLHNLRDKLMSAIEKLLEAKAGGAVDKLAGLSSNQPKPELTHVPIDALMTALLSTKDPSLQTIKKTPMPASVAGKQKWAPVSQLHMSKAEPVKLRDATFMYQPVKGSSAGSRYFLVGGNDGIRIGARYKGKTLTVRIEGPDFDTYVSKFQSMGFSNAATGNGYGSMHLDVSNDLIAAKALGAILVGLGLPLETPIPSLSIIKGMGS